MPEPRHSHGEAASINTTERAKVSQSGDPLVGGMAIELFGSGSDVEEAVGAEEDVEISSWPTEERPESSVPKDGMSPRNRSAAKTTPIGIKASLIRRFCMEGSQPGQFGSPHTGQVISASSLLKSSKSGIQALICLTQAPTVLGL